MSGETSGKARTVDYRARIDLQGLDLEVARKRLESELQGCPPSVPIEVLIDRDPDPAYLRRALDNVGHTGDVLIVSGSWAIAAAIAAGLGGKKEGSHG